MALALAGEHLEVHVHEQVRVQAGEEDSQPTEEEGKDNLDAEQGVEDNQHIAGEEQVGEHIEQTLRFEVVDHTRRRLAHSVSYDKVFG